MKEEMNASASFRPQTRRRMSVPDIGFKMKWGTRHKKVCVSIGVLRCVTVLQLITVLWCYNVKVLRCVTVSVLTSINGEEVNHFFFRGLKRCSLPISTLNVNVNVNWCVVYYLW